MYVDSGKWKARQGGNGLLSANDVKIKFTNCTAEEFAKIYRLVRPFDDELVGYLLLLAGLPLNLAEKSSMRLLFWTLGLMCQSVITAF